MLTLERAQELLECDTQAGYLVRKNCVQRPDRIGYEAGYYSEGYYKVSIDGFVYFRAQIVWLFAYGYIPKGTIDHADINKSNDAIWNLRIATKGQNAANSKINSRNTSGFKGVSLCKTTGRYRSSIQVNGHSKNLGRYATPEEARAAWANAAIEAYGVEFVRAA